MHIIPEFDKKAIDKKVRGSMPFTHKWHNKFHLEMPFGLINDPNGLCCLNGEYHIFFQWNPLGVEHKNKCWGHVTTKDFVNYTMPELSMYPTDIHDKNGCYSGSGFTENGKVRLLYTNNAKDDAGNRLATQRIATLQSDGTVIKEQNIVSSPADGYTAHYRDPYYFQKNGHEYIAIGAQRINETGAVVIYRRSSKGDTSEKWDFLGELETDDELKKFGYMWECPGVLTMYDKVSNEEKDILLFCPQGLEAEEYRFQNIYQAGYISGEIDIDSMRMIHGNFEELDRGFDFYAPQVLNHAGRHILFGWMGMPDKDDEYPTGEAGWKYSLTMPRELTLKAGHVYSLPVNEMKELWSGNHAEYCEKDLKYFEADVFETAEIEMTIALGTATQVDVSLKYDDEKLVYSYNRQEKSMSILRDGMKLGGKGSRKFHLSDDGDLKILLYVDKTAIESFFQDGYEAASILIFKKQDTLPKITIDTDDNADNISIQIHELSGFSYR